MLFSLRFNIFERYGRQMDVKATLRVYWVENNFFYNIFYQSTKYTDRIIHILKQPHMGLRS